MDAKQGKCFFFIYISDDLIYLLIKDFFFNRSHSTSSTKNYIYNVIRIINVCVLLLKLLTFFFVYSVIATIKNYVNTN